MAQWHESLISDARITALLKKGFMSAAEAAGCRIPVDRFRPALWPGEIVTFAAFHERGLALPSHTFFRGLLIYYGLELHHLTPGAILHVAAFITLCEAYLGIEPHFDLWKYFFHARAVSGKKDGGSIAEYGGVNLQLRSGKGGEYFHLPLATSNKGWHHEWFMIKNFEPPLPAFTGAAPVPSDAWKWGVAADDKKKLEVVLVQVAALVREGLTGEAVLRTFYFAAAVPSSRDVAVHRPR